MALVNCSDCGKEISDNAIKCGNCGNQNTPGEKGEEKELKSNMTKLAVLFSIPFSLILIFLALLTGDFLIIVFAIIFVIGLIIIAAK